MIETGDVATNGKPRDGAVDDRPPRERILEIGLAAFADHGFDGATTRMIAERAGVNVAMIKYYFGSKEELWREAAALAFAGVRETLGDALDDAAGLAPLDRVRVLVRRYARFVSRRPEAMRLLHGEGTRDGERMRWLIDQHQRPVYDLVRELTLELQRDGVIPKETDPMHFFYIFVGAISLIFQQAPECAYLTGTDPRDPAVARKHADTVVDLVVGSARAKGSS